MSDAPRGMERIAPLFDGAAYVKRVQDRMRAKEPHTYEEWDRYIRQWHAFSIRKARYQSAMAHREFVWTEEDEATWERGLPEQIQDAMTFQSKHSEETKK